MMNQEDDDVVDERANRELKNINIVKFDVKKVVIGAGARVLFYPTLLYNVLRYKIESDFRWWDQVYQFLLLGAVPFPRDVPRLKQLGVGGVITLNEPFETLVPPSLYKAHGMEHLIVPTRDYLYAPSVHDINKAVDFIHNNASSGKTTYVHCKAGRGRSTTIALCYLVKYKQMTPSTAMDLIRAKRPRVLLTSKQAKAVQQYYRSCLPFSEHSPTSYEVLVRQDHLGECKSNADSISQESVFLQYKQSLKTRFYSLLSSLSIARSCVSVCRPQPKRSTC